MIDTLQDLQSLIQRAQQGPCVALDTEFVWEQTYYPRLGIVQLGLSDTDCISGGVAGGPVVHHGRLWRGFVDDSDLG